MSRIYNEMIDTVITFFRQSDCALHAKQFLKNVHSLAIACVMDWMVHRVTHLWAVMGFYQMYHAVTYQRRGAGEISDFNQIYFLPNLVCTIWQRYSFVHIESVNHWKLGHNIFFRENICCKTCPFCSCSGPIPWRYPVHVF